MSSSEKDVLYVCLPVRGKRSHTFRGGHPENVVLSGCSSHNILLPKKSQHCSNKVRMSPSLYM